MKAKKIIYEKLVNLGNYQHEKIGIEIEIQEGETASDVLAKARLFVDISTDNAEFKKYERCKEILHNRDVNRYSSVIEAEKFVKEYEEKSKDNLPF